jgi:F0F1-type ATP synthase assembly protein I
MSLDADAQRRAERVRAEQASTQESTDRRDLWVGMEQGSVMGLELLVAICFWAGAGWLADRWLDTGPWLLTVGALVGFGAGMYLIWLRSERLNAADDARRARRRADDDAARRARVAEAAPGTEGSRRVR